MFWLPSKTVYTGPRKQRGNIVVGLGFPPTRLVAPDGTYVDDGLPSPGGAWTVADDWTTAVGELSVIENAFLASGGTVRDGTLHWSPDGSILTLSSSGSDDTKMFSCSTAFDPDTATQVYTMVKTNPGWGRWNTAGTRYLENEATDTYRLYAGSGFVVTSSTALSSVSKTDVGLTGSVDAPAVWGHDLTWCQWFGQDGGGDAIKYVTFPGGDLDLYVVQNTYHNGSINPNSQEFSNFDCTETAFFKAAGSQGVSIVTFASAQVSSGWAESADYAIRNTAIAPSFDFRPGSFWFDPDDTQYVWGCAAPTGNFQMVKWNTNVQAN